MWSKKMVKFLYCLVSHKGNKLQTTDAENQDTDGLLDEPCYNPMSHKATAVWQYERWLDEHN